MGIVFASGAEHGLGINAEEINGTVASQTTFKKTGNYGYQIGSGSGTAISYWTIPLPVANEYYVGLWMRRGGTGLENRQFVGFDDFRIGNTIEIAPNIHRFQALNVFPVVATGSLPSQAGVFEHLQVHVLIDGANSRIRTRLHGILDIDWTGNLGSSPLTSLKLNIRNDAQTFFDDIVVRDDTWPGDVRIVGLLPTADTAQKDWTPDTGSVNFSRVNNNSDASYVSSSINGHKDLYELADWSNSGLTPVALTHWLRARKETADVQGIKLLLKSGATESATPKIDILAAGYRNYFRTHHQDPNTSAAWTSAAIDALQIGQEYVD